MAQGKLTGALRLHKQVLSRAQSEYGELHLKTATAYNDAGGVYHQMAKFSEAQVSPDT